MSSDSDKTYGGKCVDCGSPLNCMKSIFTRTDEPCGAPSVAYSTSTRKTS